MYNMSILFSVYVPNAHLGNFINFIISLAPVMTPFVALFGALFVANISGIREEKKILIGKQSNPPNLALYKAWLDTSEKYIDLMGRKSVYGLTFLSDEYVNIEAGRKGALAPLKWERMLEILCLDSSVKFYLSTMRQGVIERILDHGFKDVILLSEDYFRPVKVRKTWAYLIFSAGIVDILIIIFGLNYTITMKIVQVVVILILLPLVYLIIFKYFPYHKIHKADISLRSLIVEDFDKKICVSYFDEVDLMRQRLRSAAFSALPDEFDEVGIYYPWEYKNNLMKCFMKMVAFLCPGYYVNQAISGKECELWGAYKNERFNGDIRNYIDSSNESSVGNVEQKLISEMSSRPAVGYVPQALRKSARASK